MSEPLLLDTHCWVWLQLGITRKFSRQTVQAIDRAMRRDGCSISIISIWEVGMLCSKKRIQLKVSAFDWVKEALKTPGVTLIPLSIDASLEASHLPGEFHGDPADRLLVATARLLRATMVTADERIIEYGRQKHLNVLSA